MVCIPQVVLLDRWQCTVRQPTFTVWDNFVRKRASLIAMWRTLSLNQALSTEQLERSAESLHLLVSSMSPRFRLQNKN